MEAVAPHGADRIQGRALVGHVRIAYPICLSLDHGILKAAEVTEVHGPVQRPVDAVFDGAAHSRTALFVRVDEGGHPVVGGMPVVLEQSDDLASRRRKAVSAKLVVMFAASASGLVP